MSGTLKLILTLSLVLNVLMSGLGIGYAYKVWRYRMPDGMERAQMSESSRDRVDEVFGALRRDMKAHFVEMRAARRHLIDIIETEPFDMVAYDDALQKMTALQMQMGKARAEAVRGLAAELPAEDRKILSRYFSRPFSGKHRGCFRSGDRKAGGEDPRASAEGAGDPGR